jgi:hypothetical protein
LHIFRTSASSPLSPLPLSMMLGKKITPRRLDTEIKVVI